MDDVRVIDVYELVSQQSVPLAHRTGNWVQEYSQAEEALRFINAQFKDVKRLRELLQEGTA